MKKLRSGSIIVVFFAVFFLSALSARAALELRGTDSLGNQLIYDTDLNITWYDYTNSYNTWQDQVEWASALAVDFGGTIYDDWRLPATVDGLNVFGYNGTTTAGYNITSSEMGHLFYTELGNKGYYSASGSNQSGYGLTNAGGFEHLLSGDYWYGTEYSDYPTYAWGFNISFGSQGSVNKGNNLYAFAVRAGDVPLNVVPEPVSLILFGVGGVVLVASKKLLKRRG